MKVEKKLLKWKVQMKCFSKRRFFVWLQEIWTLLNKEIKQYDFQKGSSGSHNASTFKVEEEKKTANTNFSQHKVNLAYQK